MGGKIVYEKGRFKMTDYNLHAFFLSLVDEKGGFVCHHAHLDKAYLINPKNLKLSQDSLQQKWVLYRQLKKDYTEESLHTRICRGVENLRVQGITKCRTFVDADELVGLMPVKVAHNIKREYAKKGFDLQIAIQPLEGVLNKPSQETFVKACEIADVIGGLPDRDKVPKEHMDFIFGLAKEMNKTVDVHVGQNNVPSEQESEMVVDKVIEHGLEGRVNLVHAISLSCQSKADRERVTSKLRDTGTGVVVCPSAALSMKQQSDIVAPIHNSIAPVLELHQAGVDVMMGVDNICDLFLPLVDGDMWFESRLMMEAIRCYDLNLISDIATSTRGF